MDLHRLEQIFAQRAAEYRAAGYYNDDTLLSLLHACVVRHPDKVAIVTEARTLTFAQWYDEALRLAGALQGLGIEKGDVVALQLPNRVEFLVGFVAITACGAMAQTIHMPYRDAEVRFLLGHSGAKGVLCMADAGGHSPAQAALALTHDLASLEHVICVGGAVDGARAYPNLIEHEPARALPATGGEDEFVLLYTSGTTGNPKGVPVRNCWFMANARIAGEDWAINGDDVIMSVAPFTHLYGLWTILLALYAGARTALLPVFSPHAMAQVLRGCQPTGIFAVPAHIGALMQAGLWQELPTDDVRFICQAGSIVPRYIAAAIDAKLVNGTVLQLFGMSELQAGCYTVPADIEVNRLETSGMAPRGMETRIVDETGKAVPQGDEGHLQSRGIAVFWRYLNNEGATGEAFTEDGWFRTGDMAYYNAAGRVIITGRSKELVNRGGIKYHPAEVEDIVNQMGEICASAVVPYADAVLGERACLFVELAEGRQVSLEQVCQHLAEAGLAKFKWPERLEVVDAMPLTPTRKIIRGRLGQRL